MMCSLLHIVVDENMGYLKKTYAYFSVYYFLLFFSIAKKIYTVFEKKFIVEIYPLFSVCIHKIIHILKRGIYYMLLKIFFFIFLAANFYSNSEKK